ncbi:hypothetical protein LTR70_000942 [Exophiala xenobiotica]|nr:hypothetical protein LTR70_000942 [Exophiala xenobiotica]
MQCLSSQSQTSSSPSLNGSVSSPSPENVKVVVGSEKVEYILPEDTLAPAPGLLCLLSGSGTSMRAVELPNDDPAIIECILRWLLKHGQIADIPANLKINVRQKSETRYALELIQLYACAVKYNVEGLANDIVDAFIIHSSVRLVAPCAITALTHAGLSQSVLRKYLLTRLAYDIVIAGKHFERSTPTGASWDVYCFQNPDLEAEIRSFDPADTVDLFRHCSMVYGSGSSGMYLAPPYFHEALHLLMSQEYIQI